MQSIRRAASILQVLAASGRARMRLVDVIRESGLKKSTVVRMLDALRIEGLVTYEPVTRSYRLGQRLAHLGSAAELNRPLAEIARPHLDALAQASGCDAFLIAREGLHTVLVARSQPIGRAPLSMGRDVGMWRPLGVGPGGLAILAEFNPVEVDRLLLAVRPQLEQPPVVSLQTVLDRVNETRERGYAFVRAHYTANLGGIGVAVPGLDPSEYVAISLVTELRELDERRAERLARLARPVANALGQALRHPLGDTLERRAAARAATQPDGRGAAQPAVARNRATTDRRRKS